MVDNMRILGKGLLAGQESLQQTQIKTAQQGAKRSKGSPLEVALDRIDLGVGKEIRQLLSPDEVVRERQVRVDALRKLIAAGEYKPSLDRVASALAEEISFEIAWQERNGQQEQE